MYSNLLNMIATSTFTYMIVREVDCIDELLELDYSGLLRFC